MTVEVLRPLTDEDAAAVEARVIAPERDRVRDGNGRVHSQLRQALRRAAIRVDPQARIEKQERDAFDQRRMSFYPLDAANPGMAGLAFTHHEEVLARGHRVRAGAGEGRDRRRRPRRGAHPGPGLRRRRRRPAHRAHRPTPDLPATSGPSVHVVVGAATLLGEDDQPGWLAGYGPISAQTARRIAADPTGTWRRLLTDPRSGRMDELSATTYQVPADMDRHVRARDTTCRWPGCTSPRPALRHRPPHPLARRRDRGLQPAMPVPHPPPHQNPHHNDHPARPGHRRHHRHPPVRAHLPATTRPTPRRTRPTPSPKTRPPDPADDIPPF